MLLGTVLGSSPPLLEEEMELVFCFFFEKDLSPFTGTDHQVFMGVDKYLGYRW